jgi:hypothetical protein
MAPGSRIVSFCLAGVLAGVVPASAQVRPRPAARRPPGEPRVTLSVSGGVQAAASDVSDQINVLRHVETETIDVTYPGNPGVLFDVGGRVRFWKQLGVGLAIGHVAGEGTADVAARIPHPFFFNQPRAVAGKQAGMAHEETALHLQVQYTVPASKRVRIVVGAGPSRIRLTQDVVTEVDVVETYPYDTATFSSAATRASTASVNGFNGGIDVSWFMTRGFGLGGLVRYTRAAADLEVSSGHTVAAKAGGAQAAAGVRFAF